MQTLSLEAFLADVERRKAALGIDEDFQTVDDLRNKGARRTSRKREALRRAEQRAQSAGRKAVLSYY